MSDYVYNSTFGGKELTREAHVTDLLFKLGSQDLDAQVLRLASLISKDWSNDTVAVKKVFIACVSELSDREVVYALLLAVLKAQDEEIGEELLGGVVEALQTFLNEGSWRKAKLLVRLIGELAVLKVISESDLMQLYEFLSSVLDDSASREARKDTFIDIILSCLPWTGFLLSNSEGKRLQQLMQKVDDYIQDGRPNRSEATIINCSFNETCSFNQIDELSLKWIQVRNCEENGWDCMMVNRPSIATFDDIFSKLKPIQLKTFTIPPESSKLMYPPPISHLEIFHPSFVTKKGKTVISLPPTESVDRLIMYDVLEDLIFFFHHNPSQLIKYLFQGLYVSEEVLNQYSFHQAVFEIITSKILRLPHPEYKIIYYIRLSMDLCAQSPRIVPGIFGKAINTLREHLDAMDVECQNRLSTWFSIHLSNFGFKWNWTDWKEDFQLNATTSKSLFMRETLEKLLKLSYYDRITEVFAEDYKDAIKSQVFPSAPEYFYKFAAGTSSSEDEVRLAAEVVEKMRLKTSAEDMAPLIDEIKVLGGE